MAESKVFQIKMPDGSITKVQAPADATDEQLFRFAKESKKPGRFGQVMSDIGNRGGQVMSDIGAGVANTIGFGVDPGSALLSLAPPLKEKYDSLPNWDPTRPLRRGLQSYYNKLGQDLSSQGQEPGFIKAATQGAAGGALLPIGGIVPAVISGATGALAGETASRFTDNPLVVALANFLGSGAGAYVFGPKQSVGRADIRRELEGRPDADFTKASENLRDFSGAGATTGTVAEALPGKGRIISLAAKAASSKGGEALARQLTNREDDLKGLTDTFLSRIEPNEVNSADVANRVSDVVNEVRTQGKKDRGTRIRSTLAGYNFTPERIQWLHESLMQQADRQKVAGNQAAYQEVARRLLSTELGPDGQRLPLTNLQDLSLEIAELKQQMRNPVDPRGGNNQISGNRLKEPIALVEEYFSKAFPEANKPYEKAMQEFAENSEALRELRRGPLGRLSDSNPLNANAAPVGRLNSIMQGNSPRVIESTLRTLADPNNLALPVSPKDIAKALMQERVMLGSTDVGKTIRGLPGSMEEAKVRSLIGTGIPDVDNVMQPLRVSDELQKLKPANLKDDMPDMRSSQFLIRPRRTLDMLMTFRNEAEIQKEIAELLMRRDPQIVDELRKIAAFNPNIRRALVAGQATLGLANGANNAEE